MGPQGQAGGSLAKPMVGAEGNAWQRVPRRLCGWGPGTVSAAFREINSSAEHGADGGAQSKGFSVQMTPSTFTSRHVQNGPTLARVKISLKSFPDNSF